MRQLIFSTLSNNAAVSAAVGTNIFTPNTIGTDPVPARPPTPFLIVADQPDIVHQEVRKTTRAVTKIFDIRCYDIRGDYLRIDSILKNSREALLGLALPARSPSGAVAIDIRWVGTGMDSEDPDWDLIFKSVTMRFTTNI